VSQVSDRLFEIELDLAKNAGDDEHAILARRMILREALTAWGDQRWKEGYHDGRRDLLDARSEANRRADQAAAAASDQGQASR
jgi:hypothetical protein